MRPAANQQPAPAHRARSFPHTSSIPLFLKWLYPGINVKRWLFLAVVGAALCGASITWFVGRPEPWVRIASLMGIMAGLSAFCFGVIVAARSFLEVLAPTPQDGFLDILMERRHLKNGIKIAAIGGGTGLSTLLAGLKRYTGNVTAIVTVADDGGSSGRLREEFNILPPGDLRNCLVALADADPLMRDLFQYRFTEGQSLRGHSFGNLFITALTRLTGDFEHAMGAVSRVLAVRGRVIPSTYTTVRLIAEHEDGSLTLGESNISESPRAIRRVRLEPRDPLPTPEALSAIQDADIIVLGPGSLFTSLIPNLLVPGIVEAILYSPAIKVYACNVMTQYRETHGFNASDHVKALVTHTHPQIIQWCLINLGRIPQGLLEKYREERAMPVEPDIEAIYSLGYQVAAEALVNAYNIVRHDPDKLARAIIDLASHAKHPAANGWHANGHGRWRSNGHAHVNGHGAALPTSDKEVA